MADDPLRPRKRFPIWETVAIFLAIASLWPAYVLPAITEEPAHEAWRWISYVMLGLMLVVFVRRVLAFRRFAREAEEQRRRAAEEGQEGRARLPWEPPGSPRQ